MATLERSGQNLRVKKRRKKKYESINIIFMSKKVKIFNNIFNIITFFLLF